MKGAWAMAMVGALALTIGLMLIYGRPANLTPHMLPSPLPNPATKIVRAQ